MKIAITTSSFAQFSDAPLRLLQQQNITPVINPHGRVLTEKETIEILQGCTGVAAGTEQLTATVLQACPELKVISRCGTGTDNVDKTAAAALGIILRNTPDAPTQAVVELTLGFALDLMRHITPMSTALKQGTWKKRMGNLLSSQKVGIIGFGRIGQAVAKAFAAFGCSVNFFDPFLPNDPAGVFPNLALEQLLAESDIVSLHCAKPTDGSMLLDAEKLHSMKPGAWLINAARGGIIDEEALFKLLQQKKLSGAAIDVFTQEPYTGPLATLENVLLTPHIGSYAKEARIRMETETIVNLLEELAQGTSHFVGVSPQAPAGE